MKPRPLVPGMIHTNGNLLCVVDLETTSLDLEKAEIIEIAVLPINNRLEMAKECMPFHIKMRPDFPEDIDQNALNTTKRKLDEVMACGISQDEGTDLFYRWFEELKLPYQRLIMPLGHNFSNYDKPILQKWLGIGGYPHYFHWHIRDTMIAGIYMNDRAYYQGEQKLPFQHVTLTRLCNYLGVSRQDAHTALGDCFMTLEVYRRMLGTVAGILSDCMDTSEKESDVDTKPT